MEPPKPRMDPEGEEGRTYLQVTNGRCHPGPEFADLTCAPPE